METEIITALFNSGISGDSLVLLIILAVGMFSKYGFSRKTDLDGIREHMRQQSDKRDSQVESIKDSVIEIERNVSALGKELHERIDRVEAAAKEDRERIHNTEVAVQVVKDRSYSGRCSSGKREGD